MEFEEFCDKYCPMPFRSTFRNGDPEVDCDCCECDNPTDPEHNPCPFKDVDFSRVKEHEPNQPNLESVAGMVKLDENQELPDMTFYCPNCDKMVKNTKANIADNKRVFKAVILPKGGI